MNKKEFIKELEKLNINIDDYKLNQLEKYYELLITENKKYNLTSITEKEQVYLKHFYDSLTIVKIIDLNDQSLCDIGTGAGFPGIVLKIIYPNLEVTLIDSTKKKCDFLNLVIKELNLNNITVINTRIEEYAKINREKYDIVTARAVAPLKHLLEYGIPLVKIDGYFIPLKSNVNDELINIDNYYNKLSIELVDIIEFNLPIELSKRTLLLYQKKEKTKLVYPRKYNEIKKKEI